MLNIFGLKKGDRLQRKDTFFQYSTSEQFTGEYWINGKKIYCKTVSIGSLNSASKSANHGISNFGDYLWAKGFAYSSSAKTYVSLPRGHLDNRNDSIGIECNTTQVTLIVGQANVFSSSYVILYYTKTTN